jgi:hypothetical protein
MYLSCLILFHGRGKANSDNAFNAILKFFLKNLEVKPFHFENAGFQGWYFQVAALRFLTSFGPLRMAVAFNAFYFCYVVCEASTAPLYQGEGGFRPPYDTSSFFGECQDEAEHFRRAR